MQAKKFGYTCVQKFKIKNTHMKQQLLLPTCKGAELIEPDSIIRIEAISNYSKLYFNNGKTLVVAKVLKWFEQSFGSNDATDLFLRIHRTHLVNKKYIHAYTHGKGAQIRLQNGEQLDISKRKKSYFLRSWQAAA
jgi:two-component system, LytTR family, response regulator